MAASDVELQRYLESEAALLEDLQATRLAQLRATRRRLDEMARAEARVRTKVRALDVLDAAAERDATAQALVRPLFHTGTALRDMEFHVAELRRRLAAARVAEDGGGRHEQLYAHDNAIRTADHLINGYLDASLFVAAGAMSVLEIAAHALAMFSGKPECRNLLFANGCVETAARLLKRTFSAAVVAHACAVVGNMASHDEARGRLRIMGAVGALVRLLRADCPAQVQVAAAGALALLASRDDVICDTVRVLGGLELLVAMLAHPTDVGRAEVARVTLHTLRKGNEANARSIAQTIKLDPNLVGVAHKHPYLEDFMDVSNVKHSCGKDVPCCCFRCR